MADLNTLNLDTIVENNSNLLFIDTNINNYQSLIAGSNATSIILLDSTRNGIEQITETLTNYDQVDSIQIVSHGQAGTLQLGSASLNGSNLDNYSADFAMWSKSLTENGDILLYGCNLGSGTIGQDFVTNLSQLTNADIAASDDLTGNRNLGGDWDLEIATGEIEAELMIDAATRNIYSSVLETILDFDDFTDTSQLTLNGNATQVGNVLRLTSAGKKQQGSIFFQEALAVDNNTSFSTQFQFKLSGGTGGADGFTFILQNDPQGVNALGDKGGGLGYRTVTKSLAIEFDTFKNGKDINNNHLAVLRDGDTNNVLTTVNAPFDLNSGNSLNAWIDYDGDSDLLEVFLADTLVKPETASLSQNIDLAEVVGDQAYIGFGAGTGGLTNNHDLSNWEFTTTNSDNNPGDIEAATSIEYDNFADTNQLTLNGNATQVGNALRLTSTDGLNQQGSIFFNEALAVDNNTSFSTQFEFKLSGGTDGADGFTFILQNDPQGLNALGESGGGLGYRTVTESLAIEFDTYKSGTDINNNHLAILRDGDTNNPLTTTNAPFDLNSGDFLNAWIDYDGDSDLLEVFLADTVVKPEMAFLSQNIDLAEVVGEQAYIGFSAGTGGYTNNHDLNSWEFSTTNSDNNPGDIEAATSIEYDNFVDTSQLKLNGNASQSGNNLKLTSAGKKQQGSIFYQEALTVDPDTAFATEFEFQLLGGTDGADGFTFILQNDPQGLNALGDKGGGLGYRGINQSLAIEFDTFKNGNDINNNHLAILRDGDTNNALATVNAPFDLNNGNSLNAWIDYDGESDLLEVFLADSPIKPETATLSQNIDLAEVLGDQAYIGFGAGTGGKVNSHELNNWKFTSNPYNPGVIGLETSIYNVNELDGSVEVTILRTQGSDGVVTIDYDTIDATATAREDYNAASGTLIFADGETSKTVTIPLLNDNLKEGNEDFSFTIDNLVGDATLLAPRTALIKIVDDETGLEPIIDYVDFADTSQLNLNGNAIQVGNALRLTPAAKNQQGSAFYERPLAVDSNTSFETQFQFKLGDGAVGSDGFTFMLQNSLQGLNALGDKGGGLGYRDIAQSLAIEFDTFKNGTDINNNHIAILRDGNLDNALATIAVPFDLNDGSLRNVWVNYDGNSDLLEVFLADTLVKPESALLALDIDLASVVGDQAFIGFSAATGGAFDNHDLNNWEFTTNSELLFAPPSSPDVKSETILLGLNQPSAIDWTPDGNILFVAEKGGMIKVSQNGELLDTPFIDLSAQVNGTRDRGLIDIAVHPNFFNGSPYVYAAYTYDPPEVFLNTGLAGSDGNGNRAARLTRIMADPTTNYTTAIPGSEVVILGKNSIWENFNGFANSTRDFEEPPAGILADGSNLEDFLAGDSESHTIGTVEFGSDGALYVTNGDGTSYNKADPRTFRVQDIDNLSGKVLRIDPITGEGLADNPFYNGNPNANRSKVYQLGLRNPFRMTVHPETGQVYIGEVGWSRWEEINAAAPGANFGWPYYEGGSGTNAPTREYQDLPESLAFYASGVETTSSLLGLNHSVDGINAIVLGDIYTGDAFPKEYQGDLFFNDLGQGIVRNINFDQSGNVASIDTFTTGANVVVQIMEAPDGSLYYVDLDDGIVGRWFFS